VRGRGAEKRRGGESVWQSGIRGAMGGEGRGRRREEGGERFQIFSLTIFRLPRFPLSLI
jgi:hypothetical protein